jgi:hypothetical protein
LIRSLLDCESRYEENRMSPSNEYLESAAGKAAGSASGGYRVARHGAFEMLERAGRAVKIARDFGLLDLAWRSGARRDPRSRKGAQVFGAGLVIGTAVGFLLAPTDGRTMRGQIRGAVGLRTWLKKLLTEEEALDPRVARSPFSDLRGKGPDSTRGDATRTVGGAR